MPAYLIAFVYSFAMYCLKDFRMQLQCESSFHATLDSMGKTRYPWSWPILHAPQTIPLMKGLSLTIYSSLKYNLL